MIYMRKTMMEYSEEHFNVLIKLRDNCEFMDINLMHAQQMLETEIKELLKIKTGSYTKSHNLKTLLKDCDELELYKKYYNLLMLLTNLYFTNRYESDDHEDFELDEYNEIIDNSINLYFELKVIINKYTNEMSKSDSFK